MAPTSCWIRAVVAAGGDEVEHAGLPSSSVAPSPGRTSSVSTSVACSSDVGMSACAIGASVGSTAGTTASDVDHERQRVAGLDDVALGGSSP